MRHQTRNLIETIQADGFKLEIRDHKLVVTPASRLTDKQREFIRRNRESIVRWLEQTEADCWEREVRQRLAEIDETDPDVIA